MATVAFNDAKPYDRVPTKPTRQSQQFQGATIATLLKAVI